jgi:hypothetical protein
MDSGTPQKMRIKSIILERVNHLIPLCQRAITQGKIDGRGTLPEIEGFLNTMLRAYLE